MKLTVKILDELVKKEIAEKFCEPLNETITQFNISDKALLHFLSQALHESNNLENLIESTNYTAQRLLAVFPKYFKSLEEASKYANKPIAIANKVYANRMGNGNEQSGDGYKFAGRGIFHHTGKEEYEKLSKFLKIDLINNPSLLVLPKYACLAAGWFWNTRNLNKYINLPDEQAVELVTKVINGGENGLKERKEKYKLVKQILN